MIKIQPDFPLNKLNSFGIAAFADYYTEIQTVEEIQELIQSDIYNQTNHLILGGGSNILFTQNFNGLIIHPTITGIEMVGEDENSVYAKVGSGVVWDEFVEYATGKNLGGIENLSGIPGTVGASPIQNIGAYGTEVKDVITQVEGFDLELKEFKTYDAAFCRFGYRNSLFKESLKNRFLVSYVTFRLSKPPHILVTNYGSIEQELEKYHEKTISTVRSAVCSIRSLKLPDPKKIGNAGSFFKNPVVDNNMAAKLKKAHPSVPTYPASDSTIKLSAAWLIDEAGCKGLQLGNAATHRDQPLVLVNMGGATGKEILKLSRYIKDKVYKVFNIQLEEEVNIV